MNTIEIALNTAASTLLQGRTIFFTGTDVAAPQIKFIDTKFPVIKTVYAAEVLGQATLSFTTANSTVYSFTVKQEVGGIVNTFLVSYTSDAGATEDEIEDNLGLVLTKLIATGALKASYTEGSTSLVITADAGYPLLTVIAGQNTTVGTVTVGKNAINAGADLVAAGVSNAVAGNTYTSYEFLTATLSQSAGMERDVWSKVVVYIKTSQGSIAALDTILNAAAFDAGQVELLS
jgi:hypothetical protein